MIKFPISLLEIGYTTMKETEDRKLAKRVPVVYKGQSLMPMRWGRAAKYVREGKAKFRLHRKLGTKYLELLEKPSGFDTQNTYLGFDPGAIYDGFSLTSDSCHHDNVELIHHKGIKDRMDTRRMYRHIRRGRLRNRPAKYDSRTSPKFPPTIKSIYDFRVWLIDNLLQIYPISHVIYEKPVFDFWKKKYSGFASIVMTGMTKFIKYIEDKNIEVIEKRGFDTKDRRIEIFGEDKKVSKKDDKSFYTHCIDSYSLSTLDLESHPAPNTKTRFISKDWYNRRELHQRKNRINNKVKDRCFYRKIHAGGEEEILNPWYGGKSDQVKIKVTKYPNNFSNMETRYIPRKPKYKQFRSNYGGTVWFGISKYGRYRNLETREIISVKNFSTCQKISLNKDKYEFLGYKRQTIEVAN